MDGFQQPANVMGIPGFAGSGSQDPFREALLSMFAANNPDLVAKLAAAHGIQPPTAGGGGAMGPAVGAFMAPTASPAEAAAPGTPSPAGGAANPWAMLQGVKAPTPVTPVFSGGVSGSQKAPDMNFGAQNASNGALMQLVQQLLNAGQPPQAAVGHVGGLGSYLGGR